MKTSIILVGALTTAMAISTSAMASGEDAYNSLGCAGCHGANGISNSPVWPNLAGQKSAYTVKQLKVFQTGDRVDGTMNAMAGMTAGKEKDIADWLETL
jgi:cytochrome c553